DLLFLPYLAGERAPLWNAHAQGAFIGLTTQTDAVQLMRAAVEGIVFNACWIASDLFTTVGRPRLLIASGRLLETNWIRQLVADVSGIPVAFPAGADASTLGAVTLSAIASGALTWEAAIQQAEARLATHMQAQSGARLATPRPDAQQTFQARADRFRQTVAALRMGA
ncbi:MAG TPA: FGGY-family carbohydrate kinase, partial [Ktedonobacterales bacterium]|nr:FGGY-family carbohydrate kinase [Ktedonobacterales bacterium]